MNQPVQGKNSLGKQRGVIEEEIHHGFYFLPSLKNLPNIKERGIEKFTVTELKQAPDGNHKFDSRRRRKGL
jgi:hypothetical protein